MQTQAIFVKRIFTGKEWLFDKFILIRDRIVVGIETTLESNDDVQSLPVADLAAPAFIDLQIYGGHQRLFSHYPESASLTLLNDYCRAGGAKFCMPTIATNSEEVVDAAITATREYLKHGEGILGLHLEGPWINPKRKGAHLEKFIYKPSLHDVELLLKKSDGVVKMITLAPEQCDHEIIRLLMDAGIIISAGHSDATYAEATKAFDSGVPTVTHLFNAMSPLQHRAPGLAGAAMDHDRVMASIIPDGYHVDYAAIRIAKKVMGERMFVITDAVTATDGGAYPHEAAGDKYESGGILSGSALTMYKAFCNLVDHVGIDEGEALRMCSLYPAQLLKRNDISGTIAVGGPAHLFIKRGGEIDVL